MEDLNRIIQKLTDQHSQNINVTLDKAFSLIGDYVMTLKEKAEVNRDREVLFKVELEQAQHQIHQLQAENRQLRLEFDQLGETSLEFDTHAAKDHAESLKHIREQGASYTFVDGARWMFRVMARKITYRDRTIKDLKKKLKELKK